MINASPESFAVIGEKYSLLCQIERRFATGWLVTGWRAEGKKPKIYKKDNNRGIWEGVGRGGKSEIGPKSVYNKAFAECERQISSKDGTIFEVPSPLNVGDVSCAQVTKCRRIIFKMHEVS